MRLVGYVLALVLAFFGFRRRKPPLPVGPYTTRIGVTVHPYDIIPDKLDATITKAKRLGFSLIRVDFDPQSEGVLDGFRAACAAAGMKVQLITPYVRPAGVRQVGYQSVDTFDSKEYARSVAAEAQKWAGMGVIWELINEPDNAAPLNEGQLSITQYRALVVDTCAAIRAADPTATVITGGTSGMNPGWQNQLKDLATYVDGFGAHPYGVDPDQMGQAAHDLGMPKPVYLSEFGTGAGLYSIGPESEAVIARAIHSVNGWSPEFIVYELDGYP